MLLKTTLPVRSLALVNTHHSATPFQNQNTMAVDACASISVAPLTPSDARAALALLAAEFEGELAGVGLTPSAWVALEAAALARDMAALGVVGVAREPGNNAMAGVIVLQPPVGRRPGGVSLAALAATAGLYVALRVLVRDLLLPETVFPGERLVEFLAVAPSARRRGVGRALLAWARGAAVTFAPPPARTLLSSFSALTLWVAADNEAALALYRASGFAVADDTDRAGVVTRAAASFFLGRRRFVRLVAPLGEEGESPPVTPTSVLDVAWS